MFFNLQKFYQLTLLLNYIISDSDLPLAYYGPKVASKPFLQRQVCNSGEGLFLIIDFHCLLKWNLKKSGLKWILKNTCNGFVTVECVSLLMSSNTGLIQLGGHALSVRPISGLNLNHRRLFRSNICICATMTNTHQPTYMLMQIFPNSGYV